MSVSVIVNTNTNVYMTNKHTFSTPYYFFPHSLACFFASLTCSLFLSSPPPTHRSSRSASPSSTKRPFVSFRSSSNVFVSMPEDVGLSQQSWMRVGACRLRPWAERSNQRAWFRCA